MSLTPGTRVKIKRMAPPGHIRTPHYLRGREGVIERVLGPFKNPEQLAYMVPAPERVLYRVRFEMGHIWPDAEAPQDTLDAEIYEHWIDQDAP
ncbi:nitrile hydratase [Litoreibacter ponti]|uniref:Nitrile hydratase n=1 Tax=Litoreibacter ponti TaxID=1510457 RepID=A0A2T6BH95_9RHOB|nr:SH3-like domain-containing protein [Litoreibacter ponti]PTX55431.1 nitrile hydratase [Litoreibacter ponti]